MVRVLSLGVVSVEVWRVSSVVSLLIIQVTCQVCIVVVPSPFMVAWSSLYSAAIAHGRITLLKVLSNVVVSLIALVDVTSLVLSSRYLQTLSLFKLTSTKRSFIVIAVLLSPIGV